VGLGGQPALDGTHPGPALLTGIAGHDVGAPAEVVAGRGDVDDPHTLVASGRVHRLDEAGHHGVVDGVALGGTVEPEPEHRVAHLDRQAVDGTVGLVGHRSGAAVPSAKSEAMALSAPSRSVAPPGGSGSTTGPCSRLGSRMVAWPGVVITPR